MSKENFIDIRKDKGFGYFDKERKRLCMIRCFKCGRENWAPTVASGDCAWCGHNPNKVDKSRYEAGEK